MNRPSTLVLIPLLLALGAGAQADCVYPQAPQALPNGTKATKDEMFAAQGVVKEYSKSVQDVYLPCLDKDKADAIAALDPAATDYDAQKQAIENMHAKKHNAALDELQATAGRWSEELKAFKAAGEKK